MSPRKEIASSIRGELTRTINRAADSAAALASVAEQADRLTMEFAGDAETLTRRAHALRGIVTHALGALAELQCAAGKLDALAAMRATLESTEALKA